MTPEELLKLYDMAVIYGSDSIVFLEDDIKHLKDVVPGDMLLGSDGKYHLVSVVYRPKYYYPNFLRYGVSVVTFKEGFGNKKLLEVGAQTELLCRKGGVFYDIKSMFKVVNLLDIYEHWMEICEVEENGVSYHPGEILRVSLKRGESSVPYLIGIEGGNLVVNQMIVTGCDSEKVLKFRRKEKRYGESISKIAREDDPEIVELREDSERQEVPEAQDG